MAAFLAGTASVLALGGCASPGSPRAPSLHLPAVVKDLTAARVADRIELRFTAPSRSSDGLPLPPRPLSATLCREIGNNPCEPVPELPARIPLPAASPQPSRSPEITWNDDLPAPLRTGPPRPIAYRLEVFSEAGRTAGYSLPVYAVAGSAPPAVQNLRAAGSRLGVVLRWSPDPSSSAEVLLRRQDLASPPARPSKPASHAEMMTGQHHPAVGPASGAPRRPREAAPSPIVWLDSEATATAPGRPAPSMLKEPGTLDTTAVRDTPYRYTAVRRIVVQAGEQTLEMRSSESNPAEITLRAIYPPQAPSGLTAVGFTSLSTQQPAADTHTFAVDLIWQPVEDPDLAGYNVYRQPLAPHGAPTGERTRLNSSPVPQSAFRDTTASATAGYSYSVTAVDTAGNESPAVIATLQPAS